MMKRMKRMKYIRHILIGILMSLAITMVSKHMGGATLLIGYLIGMVIGVIATISQKESQSSRI
jgi:4-hydroxybenzoate polyprenyltransferase